MNLIEQSITFFIYRLITILLSKIFIIQFLTYDFKHIIIYSINQDCNLKKTNKLNNKWRKDYMKQGYKFMSRENIFKNVSTILKK
jgi:hypothetical protein